MSYIQNYSQTFCDNCYLDPDYSRQDGINTNMSVKNCNFPKNMYTYFKKEVEPKKYINGYNILNPSVRSENIDKSFSVINSDKCKNSSCIGETYITDDPRLNHVLTGTLLQLDSPPQTTYTDINTLYTDKSLDSYGKYYKNYSDINAGYITYYIPNSIKDAYYEPIFSEKRKTTGILYKDPMDSLKSYYIRDDKNECDVISNTDNVAGNFGSSFLKDTLHHREDLMSKQMSKMNTQRYEPRWY